MEINDKLLDELLAQAGINERQRINLDLRNGEGDTSQRMLNALLPGTHVPINRHTKTIETFGNMNKSQSSLYKSNLISGMGKEYG